MIEVIVFKFYLFIVLALEFKYFHPDSLFSILSLKYSLVLRYVHILFVYLPSGYHSFTDTRENIK